MNKITRVLPQVI